MSNQNNLNNLFSSGLFQNTPNKDQQNPTQNIFNDTYQGSTPNKDQQNPTQNIFNNTYQGSTPFQTNTFPSNSLQNTASSNPFGMPSSQFSLPAPATSTNTYTGMASTPNTNSNPLFGNNNQTPSWSTNTSVGNIFGQKSSPLGLKNGTKDKQYEPQKIKEERGFGFLEKSADELRYEDYNLGRRPNLSSSTGFSTNMFRNTGQSTGTSLFGMSQQNPVKQEQSIFSQSTPTGFSLPSAQSNQQPFISTPSISQVQPLSASLTSANSFLTTTPLPSSSTPLGIASQTQNSNINNPFTGNYNTSGSQSFGIAQPQQSDTTMMSNTSFQPSFAFNTNASTTNTFPTTQTQSFSIPQFNYQNSSISCADVDKSDPYGIKGIKFQFIEKELSPYQRLLAEPIHKESEKPKIDKGLDFRPPEKENAYDVYFTPALHEIRGMKKISNLVMTFPGKGQIEYLEPVDVSELNVENVTKKVLFTRDHVFITDRPGKGLNLAARVSIDKIYPLCKSENRAIIGRANKYPEKGIQDRFVYTLKNNGMKDFVDYDFNKGTYVYKVQHF
ncbi:hypothetical protein P3W45_000808 [Vairimorpha bombi]